MRCSFERAVESVSDLPFVLEDDDPRARKKR